MPTAWRIVKAKLTEQAFDGEGARLYGGRWNSPGISVVYTSESIALAVLEILVHLADQETLQSYRLGSAEFDDSLLETLDPTRLPKSWRNSPAAAGLQQIGNDWIAGGSAAILQVPSVITGERESNYLLNPWHPEFAAIELQQPEPFWLDPRLR